MAAKGKIKDIKCDANNKQQIWGYLLSFLIPFILFTAALFMCKVVPFGDNTLLVWDGETQWSNFYAYLQTIFEGENDIFYTFSKVLGGSMYSLIAYYLCSPYFLIFTFVDTIHIPVAVSLITALKVATCGLTCFIYLKNQFEKTNSGTLCFSTAYALMGYNIAFYMSLSWYEGVILLPLVALGIHKILNSENNGLYILALAFAIITNFYIGYMVCLTSVIYYCAAVCLSEKPLSKLKKSIKGYMVGSLLAGGISAFLWIPVVMAMKESRLAVEASIVDIRSQFPLIDIFNKVFSLTNNGKEMAGGLPHVFIGILPFFCIILFWVNETIKLRQKVVAGSVFILYLLSFNFAMLNSIWHGFSKNLGYNYRQSFCLSFFLVIISYQGFLNLKNLKVEELTKAIGIFWIFTFLVFAKGFNLYVVNMKGIYWDMTVVSLTAIFIYLCKVLKNKKVVSLLILTCFVIHFGDITANAWYGIQKINDAYETMKQSEFENFYTRVMSAVNWVKQEDQGFYRMEKTFQKERCDPMLFAYNGMTHYSSTENDFILDFTQNLGFKRVWLRGDYSAGATQGTDSFLGIKYLLTEKENPLYKEYILRENVGNICIYENPYALPIVFISDASVTDLNSVAKNKFEFQNEIWQKISGEEENRIYNPVDYVSVHSVGMWETEPVTGIVEYVPQNRYAISYVEYSFVNEKEEPIYLCMEGKSTGGLVYTVNGNILNADLTEEIVGIGMFGAGEIVSVRISIKNENMAENSIILGEALFYYENVKCLEMVSKQIKEAGTGDLRKISSSHLAGSIETKGKEKCLLFTIPYSDEWILKIDGERVETQKVMGALMAVPVEEGEHIFSIMYRPKGLKIGLIISIISLVFGYGEIFFMLKFSARLRCMKKVNGWVKDVDKGF